MAADRDQLAAQLADVRAKLADAEVQLAAAQTRLTDVEAQWADAQTRQAEADMLAAELNDLQQRSAELERQLADQASQSSSSDSQTAGLLAERERLTRRLEEAEAKLSDAESGDDGDAAKELADMQRRYQLAMDDVRELKKKNAELERQASSGGRAAAQAAPVASGDGMDWEAQKRRLLAALEANEDQADDEDEEQRTERLKIRDVLAKTDAVIAAKDQEIAELKQLLEAQSDSIGGMAVGAQAIAELLNQDEVVAAERERLQQLQKEWEEKLRQAEVEMSVQRAKIARERVELEERQRQIQQQQAEQQESDGGAGEGGKAKKPQRGRWLTRLGLKDQDEE